MHQKVQFFIALTVFCSLTILVTAIINVYYNIQLHEQSSLNNYLQSQIDVEKSTLDGLDQEQKAELDLQVQLQFLINLYNKNFNVIRLLNEIDALVPQNINLNKIERIDTFVKLSGSAQTDADVTLFKQAIEKSLIFYNPKVSQLTSEKNSTRVNFVLEVVQKE